MTKIELFLRKTTFLKTTSVSVIIFLLATFTIFLCSCSVNRFQNAGAGADSPLPVVTGTVSSADTRNGESQFIDVADSSVYSFDFENIRIKSSQSLDIEIRNCNLYMDMYGDLIILGEVCNASDQSKTDIRITIDFVRPDGELLETEVVEAYVNYLQPGKRLPFCYIYSDRSKYMDISEVQIGVNFNNYNRDFIGSTVVSGENFYYKDNILVIDGSILNIGQSDIEDLKLFCTFYNMKDQVVFIKEGYLQDREIEVFDKQEFEIKVLLDEYTRDFTHYRLGVFFRDSFKVEEI